MATIKFPQDFIWGSATASYQIEGAYNEDGRGMSIWDTFSRIPGKVVNGDTGDIACDSYHRYEEDIELIKQLGVSSYRFSIAWPRIIPDGDGAINPKGLAYYHTFIDKLIEAGIEPYLTLYHWDLPQALQDKGGWTNRATIDAFVRYSELMFNEFHGKVKNWITINEPWCASFLAHTIGEHAPGFKDLQMGVDTAHHLLVAHGKTVKAFRELGYDGQIGYAPNISWKEPYSNKQEDVDAAWREVAYFVEWFMDPVFKGSYPQALVEVFKRHGAELHIESGDMELISQPIDFMGINYYSGSVCRYKKDAGMFESEFIELGYDRTEMNWPIFSKGFYDCLMYVKKLYGDIPLFITENGACYGDEPVDGRVRDDRRISYLSSHITELNRAIESGVNLKGYFTWSLMDNFEWAFGYDKRFGLIHVDFNTQVRTKKDSYFWFQKVASTNGLDI